MALRSSTYSLAAVLTTVAAPALAAPPDACAALQGLARPDLKITGAQSVAAGTQMIGMAPRSMPVQVPAHCQVRGVINPRTGAKGMTSASASSCACHRTGTVGSCSRAAGAWAASSSRRWRRRDRDRPRWPAASPSPAPTPVTRASTHPSPSTSRRALTTPMSPWAKQNAVKIRVFEVT